jgi:hypothetical protein
LSHELKLVGKLLYFSIASQESPQQKIVFAANAQFRIEQPLKDENTLSVLSGQHVFGIGSWRPYFDNGRV